MANRTLNTCKKCGWQWFSNRESHSCAHCHTTLWNRERKIRRDNETAQQAIALRKSSLCLTLKQIGDKLGVSSERVRQILKREGLPTRRYYHKPHCARCGKLLLSNNKTGYCIKCLPIIHSVPLICDNCGKLFNRRQTLVIRDNRKLNYSGQTFCSKKCQGAYCGKHYGFAIRPENSGRHQIKDYAPVISASQQMRQEGYTYREIAKSLNLNTSTLHWILTTNNALVNVPRHLLRNIYHKPYKDRKPQIAKAHIRVNWLKQLNFTDNEIIALTNCSKSTIFRASKR